jgi:16S rRNA (cytosine1402-N4)-methyltransferase
VTQPVHVSVLLNEVLEALQPQPGQHIVDGTLGGGGHTRAIAAKVGPEGAVLAIDRDPAAIAAAEANLRGLPVLLAHASYRELPELLREVNWPPVDGVVLDLGLSSDQLADRERGFSFDADGPLDLRFDPTVGEPAARLVNQLKVENLANLIYELGEERYSRRVARAIAEAREQAPIRTAAELAAIVRRVVPKSRHERIDPATRTFQALRIAVNDELGALHDILQSLPQCVRPGGRVAIISFHSLEDRMVKQAFRDDARYHVITRRPITASEEELAANPRSRSAKLRVAEIVHPS